MDTSARRFGGSLALLAISVLLGACTAAPAVNPPAATAAPAFLDLDGTVTRIHFEDEDLSGVGARLQR